MKTYATLLALTFTGCFGSLQEAGSVCTIDGGARSDVPLSLTVWFGFSGCDSQDARCTATVDGGTLQLTTSATICSTGTNPGGAQFGATCEIPPLAPGRYTLAPFNRSLDVLADGGGGTSCTQ